MFEFPVLADNTLMSSSLALTRKDRKAKPLDSNSGEFTGPEIQTGKL